MKGILYLIPVPIADVQETANLVYPLLDSTLNSLAEFIVEDARSARRALRKMGFKGEFDKTILHILNEHTRITDSQNFLASAENGRNIGLLSDAGMPCIADPGSDIVRLAHAKSIRVVPLYGQSSIFLAIAASGLNGQNFCFHGYLPKSQEERKSKLRQIEKQMGTQVFIETPYRNNHLLEDIISICSADTLLCIAMNIAGTSESVLTKSIGEWRKGVLPDMDKQPAVFLLGK
jgi:16S rRNA (cytidine1402-2'-O)-methyltransferase